MAQANIDQSCPQDWDYLSEGGSTIVFSYKGPFHPHFTGRVLRLRKGSNRSSLDGAESSLDNTVDEEDDPIIAFQNIVIPLLVPSEFLPKLDVVLLEAEWLTALEMLRDGERPVKRRAKGRIDKRRQKGILATDLVGGADVLTVEIKPKWGFMPNPAHLSQETAEVKMTTCRFCMQTSFNAKDEAPSTQYCPLDLYSRDEARMRKAICDLWNGWVRSNGTLNNLKVFLSGKMIRPCQSYSSLMKLLSTGTEVHEALATALLPLLRTPVLRTISNLQRSLDALDIEGITKLHAMSYPNAKGLGNVKRNTSLEEWQEFATSYHSVYCKLDHSKLCPEDIDMYLKAYLLSATFKDCSIMCKIRRSEVSGEPSVEPDGIFIIDLDLKGIDRLERWALLDGQIVEHYRERVQSKLCVE